MCLILVYGLLSLHPPHYEEKLLSKVSPSQKILFAIDEVGLVDHLVAIARQFSDAGGSAYVVELSGLKLPEWAKSSLGFATFVPESQGLARANKWDAIWFARPYPRALAQEWQKIQRQIPVVYSGYGLPISRWDESAPLPFLQEVCNLIILRSSSEEERIRDLGLSHKAIAAGDPLLHDVITARRFWQESSGYRSLLWAPHWSKKISGARGFYNWRWTVGPLLRHMRKNPNLKLVVRAHPFLFRPGSEFSRHRNVRKLFSLPNVSNSDSSLIRDIERADALITDGVSIIGYFAATGKPLVITNHLLFRPPFSFEGKKLAGAARRVSTSWGVKRFLALLQRDYANALSKKVVPQELLRELLIVTGIPPGEWLARYRFKSADS